jgi:hypothetical protein
MEQSEGDMVNQTLKAAGAMVLIGLSARWAPTLTAGDADPTLNGAAKPKRKVASPASHRGDRLDTHHQCRH